MIDLIELQKKCFDKALQHSEHKKLLAQEEMPTKKTWWTKGISAFCNLVIAIAIGKWIAGFI